MYSMFILLMYLLRTLNISLYLLGNKIYMFNTSLMNWRPGLQEHTDDTNPGCMCAIEARWSSNVALV